VRPLRVRMQAFGPYAGVQELDFADLRGYDFFLMTGPTGSGKTTVLDAIAFALYGDTSGGERDARDMRSQHAPPDLLTEVEFEFAVGDKDYRALRVPQQTRPAKRGEGTVTQLQQATLWALEGDGAGTSSPAKPLADGWSNVTKAAEDILGFRCEQFRQVVMLPQGRFQELLQAKSQDKEKILATLFDTAFYARLELALKARAVAITKADDELNVERRTILDQIGVEDDEDLAAQRAASKGEGDAAADEVRSRGDEYAAAQTTLVEAQAVAARLTDLATARERVAVLDARVEHIETRRVELELAAKAATLTADDEAVTQSAAELDAAESALEMVRDALAARENEKRAADEVLATEEARAPERERAAAKARHLLDLKPTVEGIAALGAQVERAGTLRDAAVAEAQATRDTAKRASDAATAASRLLHEARAAGAGVAALKTVAEHAATKARQRRRLDTAAARHDDAVHDASRLTKVAAATDERYDESVDHLRSLEAAWQSGQAAVLAASLKPGAPCPVCGSTEHPAPAAPGEAAPPGDDALDAARAVLDGLFAERDAARQRLADASQVREQAATERDQLILALGDDAALSVAACDERARVAAEESAAAETAGQTLPALEEAERRTVAARDEALDHAQAAESAAATRRTEAEALAAALVERRRGVPAELTGPEALDAALAAAQAIARDLDAALEDARLAALAAAVALEKARADATHATDRATAAREASSKAAERFAARLDEQDFLDTAAWRATLREPTQLAALSDEVRIYDGEAIAARAKLEQAEQAADGLKAPDLEALQAAAASTRARADEAALVKARLDARHDALAAARHALDRIAAESAGLDEEYAVVGRIAQVATGDNPLRLNFQRFVLGVHLDRVLEIASLRLREMTGRRYELERSGQTHGRARAAGLDLDVFDAWTGESRPVSTLSGGESFMAALSLALGLAEAVQEFSGGIRLDTVFVDEGFGSLDPEALDQAISTLTTLQENGRLVGIISHLAELRERIDARLEVTAGKTGSTARFVIP